MNRDDGVDSGTIGCEADTDLLTLNSILGKLTSRIEGKSSKLGEV
jgi:hypothetical protein